MRLNEVLQWAGTACLLTMYVLMSYFKELHPWNIVAGLLGGVCYLTWCIRVANKPQMIVNGVAILVCIGGLFEAWG